MNIHMPSKEFDALADFINQRFADRVRQEGASYTQRQMAREIQERGGEISEETLRRLMNKRIKKRGLDVKTLRALVLMWGREVTDVLGITPEF